MRHKLIIIAALSALMICSCGENKQDESRDEESTVKKTDKISVENIWTRVGAEKGNSAIYFDIVNNSSKSDTLVAARSDAAELVEIHETYMRDEDKMGMRQVDGVAIPVGTTTSFKPMGHHVMLIKLTRDLKAGDTVSAGLIFKMSGEIKINSTIKNMNMKK